MAGLPQPVNQPAQAWSGQFPVPTPVTPSCGSSCVRAPDGEPPPAYVSDGTKDRGPDLKQERKSGKQRASVLDASRKLRLTKLTKAGQKQDGCQAVDGMRLRPIGSAREDARRGSSARHSTASHASWTSFGVFPKRISLDNPCRNGMHEIIEHVHLDSDGGLSNLDNDHQTFDSEQITKIPVIRKRGMQLVLAVVSVFRATGNTGYILWASTSTTARYFQNATEIRAMYKEANIQASHEIPLAEVVVGMHFLEFCVLSFLLGRFFWDIFAVFVLTTFAEKKPPAENMAVASEASADTADYPSQLGSEEKGGATASSTAMAYTASQSHKSDFATETPPAAPKSSWLTKGNSSAFIANSQGLKKSVKKAATTIFNPEPTGPAATQTHPRYMRLAKIFWKDFPRLQTFSLLRCLAYVHPNLIAKHAKDFTKRDRAARIILERFLRKAEDESPDGELVEAVAEVLMQHANQDCQDEDARGRLANEYLNMNPYGIVKKLLNSPVVKLAEQDLGEEYDCRVLRSGWRLGYFLLAENVAFFLLAITMLLCGALAFFTKLCMVTIRLTDANSNLGWTFLWCLLFMNQVMSILNTKELLLWRVETLIFGGSDAVVSTEERYIINVYLGSLAEKIWESKVLGPLMKLAIMLQLDDDDLQGLIVEEDHNAKSSVILAVKQYMRDSGESNPNWYVQWVAPTE